MVVAAAAAAAAAAVAVVAAAAYHEVAFPAAARSPARAIATAASAALSDRRGSVAVVAVAAPAVLPHQRRLVKFCVSGCVPACTRSEPCAYAGNWLAFV